MNSNINEIAKYRDKKDVSIVDIMLFGFPSSLIVYWIMQYISPGYVILILWFMVDLAGILLEILNPNIFIADYLCQMDETINDIVENNKDKDIEELKRKIIDYLETEKSLKNISSYENDNNNFKINKGNLEYKFTIML